MKKMTKEQVNKKYQGKYVEFSKCFKEYDEPQYYEVRKTYSEIHENTTLGEDVGTELEYRR